MNKIREVGKRGGSNGIRYTPSKRQSRTSGPKLVSAAFNGRDVDVSDKLRRLTSVRSSSLGKANEVYSPKDEGVSSGEDNTENKFGYNSEMGGGSQGEEDVRPHSRRFKAHGKASKDCSAVDPAAVPRKLRSAVNKRNRESVSPPLPNGKKHQHTPNVAELAPMAHVNGLRRSKQNLRQSFMERSSKQFLSGTVTKDEEEVAETLFALARMVPQEPVKSGVDKRKVEEKPGSLPEIETISGPSAEASKEKHTKSAHISTDTEASNLSLVEENLVKIPIEIEPQAELTVSDQPSVSGCQKLDLESENIAQADLQRVASVSANQLMAIPSLTVVANSSHPNEVSTELCSVNGCVNLVANSSHPNEVSTELCSVNGLLTSLQSQAISVREPGNGSLLPLPAVVKCEEPIKMNTETIPCLGVLEGGTPDIWSRLPGSFAVDDHLARSSSAKSAPLPGLMTSATRPGSIGNDVSMEKLPSYVGKQSWKRCAAHVYISRLIHAHQSAEKKPRWQTLQPNHSKTKEGRKIGSVATKDPRSSCDTELGILPEKRLHQDPPATATSSTYAQQNQNCEFLSLSGGGELGKSSSGIDSSSQLHVPYLHSFVQHHPVLPFSLQPPRFATAYPDQLAAATQQWQLPQYLANPFYAAQLSSGGSGKQQQQQQMWAAQLAQQYRPVVPSSHIPKWQNGSIVPCSQTVISASPSIEALCAKYSPSAPQLYSVSSSSSTRGRATKQQQQQQQQLPPSAGYDEAVRFRPENSSPLQLLCNADHM